MPRFDESFLDEDHPLPLFDKGILLKTGIRKTEAHILETPISSSFGILSAESIFSDSIWDAGTPFSYPTLYIQYSREAPAVFKVTDSLFNEKCTSEADARPLARSEVHWPGRPCVETAVRYLPNLTTTFVTLP